MLVAAVGLTEVDGAFTLGGPTGSSGGVALGTTLGSVLLVMMSVKSCSTLMCCIFCCGGSLYCSVFRMLSAL